jgi:hypothetical protein
MKKALALSAVVAALGLGAMTASALPSGKESVNFHSTLNVQNGSKIKQVSVSNKDILALISNEFSEALPNGAILATYGLDSEEFTVLYPNGSTFISNASSGSGSYELFMWPDEDDEYVYDDSKEPINVTTDDGYFEYVDSSDTYYIYFQGSMKFSDNTDTANESYNMPNAAGYFYMPIGVGNDRGIMTGGISGSGKDVDYWW